MRVQLIFGILFIISTQLVAQGITGPEIIKKVNEVMNQKSSQAVMTMTILTTSGQERTFEYLSYSSNFGEKNLIIYQKPSRVKGQKMLMTNHADDIWYYNARTKRVRKLATHAKKQKFEGSDFSYEDMGTGDAFITDFETKLIGDEKKQDADCYKVELTKKQNSDIAYSKLVMWVNKENFVPLTIDYHDEKNPDVLLKTLVVSDIETIQGIPTGKKMMMINLADNTHTTMTIKEVKYNMELDDELFTERGLDK